MVRDADTAALVASDRRDLLSPPNGRMEASFDLSLRHGYDVRLGDILSVEHWDLPWAGTRRCQVRRLTTNLDDLIISIGIRDIDDLLTASAPGEEDEDEVVLTHARITTSGANEVSIKATSAVLYSVHIYSAAAYPIYVKLHDTAGTPTAGR